MSVKKRNKPLPRREFLQQVHEIVCDGDLSAKELAKKIGKGYSTLMRELNPNDTGAKLGALTLMDIMWEKGDITPLQMMAESLGYDVVPVKEQTKVHMCRSIFAQIASRPVSDNLSSLKKLTTI